MGRKGGTTIWLVTMGAVLALWAGACSYLWLPCYLEGERLGQEAAALARQNQAVSRFAATFSSSEAAYEQALGRLEEQAEEARARLPLEQELEREAVLAAAYRGVEEAGARLVTAKWGSQRPAGQGLAALPLELVLEGDYLALQRAVAALEAGRGGLSLGRFNSLQLQRGQAGLELRGSLLFFMRKTKGNS